MYRGPISGLGKGRAPATCARCGRSGHSIQDCFARTAYDGQELTFSGLGKGRAPATCARCGRTGHSIHDCFARTTHDGHELAQGGKRKRSVSAKGRRSGVYVLQYQDGNMYVGKSNDIDARIRQHAARAVKCTSGWQGSPREVKPITMAMEEDHESWERNETLELMSRHGVEKVRGWMYTTQELSQDTIESIDAQLCEKYDLCRTCGMKGHFVSACPMNKKKNVKKPSSSFKRHRPNDDEEDDSSCFSEESDSSCFSGEEPGDSCCLDGSYDDDDNEEEEWDDGYDEGFDDGGFSD